MRLRTFSARSAHVKPCISSFVALRLRHECTGMALMDCWRQSHVAEASFTCVAVRDSTKGQCYMSPDLTSNIMNRHEWRTSVTNKPVRIQTSTAHHRLVPSAAGFSRRAPSAQVDRSMYECRQCTSRVDKRRKWVSRCHNCLNTRLMSKPQNQLHTAVLVGMSSHPARSS